MSKHRIEISQDFKRPVEEIFSILSNHERLADVFGVPVRRIKDGEGDVNGVGSVRALGFGALATEETVVAVLPNESIEYTITKNGGPLRNHYGRIRFAESANGSRLTWLITFDSFPLLGTIAERALGGAIRRGLRKLS